MSPIARHPHRGPDDVAAAHEALALDYDHEADLAAAKPVTGPRRETLTLAGAIGLGEHLRRRIAAEEAPPTESRCHLLVPLHTTVIGFIIVGIVDLPVMAWISAGIFNVDPGRPFGIRLLIAIIVAIIVTAGAAIGLHHSGHSLRNHKNFRRSLEFDSLTFGAVLILLGATTLAIGIAALAYWRIVTEGALSGQAWLAIFLAALAALVMLVSSALIAANAFRDGSDLTDDVAFLSRVVQRRLATVNALRHKAHRHRHEAERIRAATRPALLPYGDTTASTPEDRATT